MKEGEEVTEGGTEMTEDEEVNDGACNVDAGGEDVSAGDVGLRGVANTGGGDGGIGDECPGKARRAIGLGLHGEDRGEERKLCAPRVVVDGGSICF